MFFRAVAVERLRIMTSLTAGIGRLQIVHSSAA
jgi:hypothetical protein